MYKRQVLAVDGVPVSAGEVDRVAAWAALLHPEHSRAQQRREALTGLVLPRAAAATAAPEARLAALEECRAYLDYERGGPLPPTMGPVGPPWETSGTWNELGFHYWGPATELEPGTWSEPEEGMGHWFILRVDAREPAPDARRGVLALSLRSFPYLPEDTDRRGFEQLIDERELVIVDPAWEEIVPATWKHRMRGKER